MGILAPLYIKLESTSQGEMDIQPENTTETMYGVDIVYSIWIDSTRTTLIDRKNIRFDMLKLEQLNFAYIYGLLMSQFPNSTFVK